MGARVGGGGVGGGWVGGAVENLSAAMHKLQHRSRHVGMSDHAWRCTERHAALRLDLCCAFAIPAMACESVAACSSPASAAAAEDD